MFEVWNSNELKTILGYEGNENTAFTLELHARYQDHVSLQLRHFFH